jgi:hypothetical protein
MPISQVGDLGIGVLQVKRRQHINFQLPDNYGCTLPARIHMDREYDLFEIFPDGVFLGEFRRGAKGLGPSPADSWQWSQRLSEPSDQSERDVWQRAVESGGRGTPPCEPLALGSRVQKLGRN